MTSEPMYVDDLLARAAALHERTIILDSHVDLPPTFGGPGEEADKDGPTQFDLAKAERGKLSGAVLTVHATAGRLIAEDREKGNQELDARYRAIAAIATNFPDRAEIARDPAEFRKMVGEGKFGIVLGFQNALPLGDDLSRIDEWAARGIRVFAFTFIGNNQWADSSRPYPYFGHSHQSNGLSELGRAAVLRLNRLGVMVDVSQLSTAALRDVLTTTKAPVVASHSAVRALVDTDRNLSDDELRGIRDGGGVVQVVAFGPYLDPLKPEMMGKLQALWREYGLAEPRSLTEALSINDPRTADWTAEVFWEFLHEFHVVLELDRPTAGVTHLVDAIDHTVKTIGINHVGIASDFNHSGGVRGWMHAGQTLNVTTELLRRGYGDADIAKLWGENFMRVWTQVREFGRA